MAEEVELADNRTWPPPPPFYKHFGAKNVDQFKELKKQELGDTYEESSLFNSETSRVLDIPENLRYLVPPEPPTEGKYRVFTELQEVSYHLQQVSSLPRLIAC